MSVGSRNVARQHCVNNQGTASVPPRPRAAGALIKSGLVGRPAREPSLRGDQIVRSVGTRWSGKGQSVANRSEPVTSASMTN